jgi:hypothetical protein
MSKFVSRLGALVISLFAAEMAHADFGQACYNCSNDQLCTWQFGSGWYYCGTDADGWYWCCPVGG